MEFSPPRCEQCSRNIGPELVECPERPTGSCPYRIYRRKLFPIHVAGPMLVLISIFLCGGQLAAETTLNFDRFPDYFPCISAAAMAVGLALGGLYFFTDYRRFDQQIQLHDPHTGTLWQRTSRRDKVVEEVAITGYEPVALEGRKLDSLTYPASIVAFGSDKKKNNLAAYIFKAALVSLAEQELLAFKRAEFLYAQEGEGLQPASDETIFFKSPPGGVSFEISGFNKYHPTVAVSRYTVQPGPRFEQEGVQGVVEQRLVEAMKALTGKQPIFIRNLIFGFYGEEKNHPDRWLVEQVQENAVALNLGRRSSSGLGRARFEMDPFVAEQLHTENLTIEARLEELAQLQPTLSKRLEEGVSSGLGLSTFSG